MAESVCSWLFALENCCASLGNSSRKYSCLSLPNLALVCKAGLVSVRLGSKKGGLRLLLAEGRRTGIMQCTRMAVPRDDSETERHLHCALDYLASCRKETIAFQYFKNIVALKINLELSSIVDVWMLVVFS